MPYDPIIGVFLRFIFFCGGASATLGRWFNEYRVCRDRSANSMDLRGLCNFADAFIIATMRSATHLQASRDRLVEKLREEGLRPINRSDRAAVRWALVDLSDVIVHLFDAETRDYYDLENLWGDAQRVAWEELALA